MEHRTKNIDHGTWNIEHKKENRGRGFFSSGVFHVSCSMFHVPRGFTLIEMIVAIAIFANVMLLATSALLSIVDANRKAQSLQTAVNNINFAIDGMARAMRVGRNYHCGSSGDLSAPSDCSSSPESFIAFRSKDGVVVAYRLKITDTTTGTGELQRAVGSFNESDFVALTAPEVKIDRFQAFVTGSVSGDGLQPKVLLLLGGEVVSARRAGTRFDLETMISARGFDS